MNDIQNLIPFNTACDEFVAGKYILADIKISSILKLIEANNKLTNLMQECLSNYNFEADLKQLNETNILILPTNEKQLASFVYSLLSSFSSGLLNFSDFIKRFYSSANSNENFVEFANNVITPFKDAVNSIYNKTQVAIETDDYQNNIYNKLKTNIKLILSNIDNFKLKLTEKEEFVMLLNALHISSEKNDKKLCYSLMIGLDYFSKHNKRTRNAYLSLEECFAQ